MKFSFFSKYFLTFLLVVASAMMISAQSGVSSVTGVVTDSNGQVVVGANVTLVSTSQGTKRSIVSGSDGRYTFSAVQPGPYSIEVEAQGFKKGITTDVQALVDKPTEIAVVLEVGEISAIVTVDAGSIESIVNKTDASLGNNFVAKQINELPVESRNVVNLLSLQPGVTPDGAVAGGRQDQANITLDGVDVNDQQTGLNIDQNEAFSPVLRVTPDSIEEFRVTTTNPDASKGRSAGAQVALITKGGTNTFHGNLFEFHRNTVTTANDWFSNAAGIPRAKLIRNLYGGSLGGPIIKDKLFFFYNYEGMREAKDGAVTQIVPLPSMAQGIRFIDSNGINRLITNAQINTFTLGGLPVVDVNPAAQALFAAAATRYPSNLTGVGDDLNTGGFRFNVPLPVKQSTHTAKFDWAITNDQKHMASFRANYQQDVFGRPSAFPDTPPADRWSHPLGLAASHTWLISNNLTNRFTYGLTRLAFSNQGDSGANAITFRDIYTPLNFTRTQSRVNPTHNIGNDMTWIRGNHTFQFGTNIRIIRNKRTNLASAFDNGVANYGFYPGSGASLVTAVNEWLSTNAPAGTTVGGGSIRSAQSSLAALLGRINQYTANFIFDIDGKPVNGQPTVREWATEEYDFYVQDSWKLRQSLTLNLGLRYGLSRPVYETQGFQAAPSIALDEYFARRQAAAFNGQNYTEALTINKIGPKNGGPDYYEWDKNNWQPRVSFAWSPNFKEGGMLAKIFGTERASVLRGGFAITNDYFGQQLAVQFDAANTLGFVSRYTTPANTFNITTNPAPAYTGPGMNIRTLPGVVIPGNLVFPLQAPANNARRIESSLDRGVKSPVNYSWNLTYGRELPLKMYMEASYIARLARNLLATRDVMTPNNLRDPVSGQTWYDAAGQLELIRRARYDGPNGAPNPNAAGIANNPYWDNLFGGPGALSTRLFNAGCTDDATLSNTQAVYQASVYCVGDNDWSTMQDVLDAVSGRRLFYQSQYGALDSFGTIANSDYHAAAFSLRQRLSGLSWDLNYTYAKSLDDTSGLQTAGAFGGAFILNPLRQRDNYGPSDFDMRHIINFNSLWELPVGKGKKFFNDMHPVLDALVGGWQLTTIVRYNSGEPIGTGNKFFDNAGWVTNWNLKSAVVQIAPLKTGVYFPADGGTPTMFQNAEAAYKSFRSPLPGESGDRNRLRFPSTYVMDAGLHKSFRMPWSENHKVNIRWETFNLTNTPIFSGINDTSLGYYPNGTGGPSGAFGAYSFAKSFRVMQFAIRYDF